MGDSIKKYKEMIEDGLIDEDGNSINKDEGKIAKLTRELKQAESSVPVNNMGKWAKQVKVDRIRERILEERKRLLIELMRLDEELGLYDKDNS